MLITRLFSLFVFAFLALPAYSASTEVWTPQVKFQLEDDNYLQTLTWISGFSYALSETAKEVKKA